MSMRALGKAVITFQGFDTFDTPPSVLQVTARTDEVTALCPVTGQPDWYSVLITYRPRYLCVESKSLKLYLHSFREEGLFCEAFASRIAHDLYSALSPLSISVSVVQKARGGISLQSMASLGIPLEEEEEEEEEESSD